MARKTLTIIALFVTTMTHAAHTTGFAQYAFHPVDTTCLEAQAAQLREEDPNALFYKKKELRSAQYASLVQSPLLQEDLQSSRTYAACAEAFSFLLNPKCPLPVFSCSLQKCDDFSIQQIVWVAQAHYRGQLPETDKMLHLLDQASRALGRPYEALSQTGANVAQYPGVQSKIKLLEEHWKKNTYCALNQKNLWIVQWAMARTVLMDLYKKSHSLSKQLSDIFAPDCRDGAFDPQRFLYLLKEEIQHVPYIFSHIEPEDFCRLAYTFIPALHKTELRDLFRKILTKHISSDPENYYLKTVLDKIDLNFNTYTQTGATSDDFALLITQVWEMFDELNVNISQEQWHHSVKLLKQISGATEHIANNPKLIEFQKRPIHNRAPFPQRAQVCLSNSLIPILQTRHQMVVEQNMVLSLHTQLETLQDFHKSTSDLFTSYTKNINALHLESTAHTCALLTQQSMLLRASSLIRSSLLWHFGVEKKCEETYRSLCANSLDAEIADVQTVARKNTKEGALPTLHFPSSTWTKPTTIWMLLKNAPEANALGWDTSNKMFTGSEEDVIKAVVKDCFQYTNWQNTDKNAFLN